MTTASTPTVLPETPQFRHGICDRCVFLGIYKGHDLYVCSQDGRIMDSVLARYSHTPAGYTSGLDMTTEGRTTPDRDLLVEARARALSKGYRLPIWMKGS